jgi:hypothetical protein
MAGSAEFMKSCRQDCEKWQGKDEFIFQNWLRGTAIALPSSSRVFVYGAGADLSSSRLQHIAFIPGAAFD